MSCMGSSTPRKNIPTSSFDEGARAAARARAARAHAR
eukprot:COSAG03_NODE_15918_length_416_cov_6.605678_1_plen_36_part_10